VQTVLYSIHFPTCLSELCETQKQHHLLYFTVAEELVDFQVKVDMKIYNFTAAPWVLDKHGLNASEINPVTQKQFTGLKEDANSYKFVKESK